MAVANASCVPMLGSHGSCKEKNELTSQNATAAAAIMKSLYTYLTYTVRTFVRGQHERKGAWSAAEKTSLSDGRGANQRSRIFLLS